MSHLTRFDGLQCYNYIFRHCKRLILRLILAYLIKYTLARSKALKTSNTRLIGVYHKIIEYFCLFVNVRMPGRIAGHLVTAQQLDSSNSFLCIKSKAFTRLFFGSINKSGIYTTFLYFCAGCIRFLVHPGALIFTTYLIVAYRTQARQKGI